MGGKGNATQSNACESCAAATIVTCLTLTRIGGHMEDDHAARDDTTADGRRSMHPARNVCEGAVKHRRGVAKNQGTAPREEAPWSVTTRQAALPRFVAVRRVCLSQRSAARRADALPPWLASPKKALALGRQPFVVLR